MELINEFCVNAASMSKTLIITLLKDFTPLYLQTVGFCMTAEVLDLVATITVLQEVKTSQ